MFNLLISANPESWDSSPKEFDKNRIAVEYTTDEISERYKLLDQNAQEELQSFPTLFVIEGEQTSSRIGLVTRIKIKSHDNLVGIYFEFDPALPELPPGTIKSLRVDLDLGGWELSRTHWAIKDENLLEILIRHKLISRDQATNSKVFGNQFSQLPKQAPKQDPEIPDNTQVFIVHGHDEILKLDMMKFISSLGLDPVILHMQASSGMTIIEKIEAYSKVGFAIVLYTPCDNGAKNGQYSFTPRARQNVVFEHGYLLAKLGRSRVIALVKGEVEIPNDISGVIYVPFDDNGVWKDDLMKEMKNVGYKFE